MGAVLAERRVVDLVGHPARQVDQSGRVRPSGDDLADHRVEPIDAFAGVALPHRLREGLVTGLGVVRHRQPHHDGAVAGEGVGGQEQLVAQEGVVDGVTDDSPLVVAGDHAGHQLPLRCLDHRQVDVLLVDEATPPIGPRVAHRGPLGDAERLLLAPATDAAPQLGVAPLERRLSARERPGRHRVGDAERHRVAEEPERRHRNHRLVGNGGHRRRYPRVVGRGPTGELLDAGGRRVGVETAERRVGRRSQERHGDHQEHHDRGQAGRRHHPDAPRPTAERRLEPGVAQHREHHGERDRQQEPRKVVELGTALRGEHEDRPVEQVDAVGDAPEEPQRPERPEAGHRSHAERGAQHQGGAQQPDEYQAAARDDRVVDGDEAPRRDRRSERDDCDDLHETPLDEAEGDPPPERLMGHGDGEQRARQQLRRPGVGAVVDAVGVRQQQRDRHREAPARTEHDREGPQRTSAGPERQRDDERQHQVRLFLDREAPEVPQRGRLCEQVVVGRPRREEPPVRDVEHRRPDVEAG